MGGVLNQVWLKMSELLDKQVNAQKEKIFRGSCNLPQAHEKVCDENESRIRKNNARIKVLFMEGSPLQCPNKKPVKTMLGNHCGYNEGTICIVNG